MSERAGMKSKEVSIAEAVKLMRKSEFRATAIKVELEAELRRGDDESSCSVCDGQSTYPCLECSGVWSTYYCNDDCSSDCSDHNCDYCEEGIQTCDNCDGQSTEYGIKACYELIMEKLQQYGLSEYIAERTISNHKDDYISHWLPKGALSYIEFYNDGSVDSELTFTLKLNKIKNIFLLPKIIQAFKDLGDEVGNGIDIEGAGMHMALLHDSDGIYRPHQECSRVNGERHNNFTKSMTLLLPALYFLSSTSNQTRGLEYRIPRVSRSLPANEYGWGTENPKYSAVAYRGNSLEFRIFDTCYDNPEQALDNVVVMSRCLRYWRTTYKPSGLAKITSSTHFGSDQGRDLSRLYQTVHHIDLLNAGLRVLKPEYYHIKDIKQQRKFKTTKRTLDSNLKKQFKDAESRYKEYGDRFAWSLRVKEARLMVSYLEGTQTPLNPEAFVEESKQRAAEQMAKTPEKKAKSTYIQEIIKEYQNNCQGRYTLREG